MIHALAAVARNTKIAMVKDYKSFTQQLIFRGAGTSRCHSSCFTNGLLKFFVTQVFRIESGNHFLIHEKEGIKLENAEIRNLLDTIQEQVTSFRGSL